MSLSKIDVFMRIKHHFEYLIKHGAYQQGEALPSVRQVSLDMGVNPNTVLKAYKMLEDQKLIDIIPKKGAFVSHAHDSVKDPLKKELSSLISLLKDHYRDDEIIEFVKDILKGGK